MTEDDEDPDYEERSSEISLFRARIGRMRGEDAERDKEIFSFMEKTKGDKSPSSWREHARYLKRLMEAPVKAAVPAQKQKKKDSSVTDWL